MKLEIRDSCQTGQDKDGKYAETEEKEKAKQHNTDANRNQEFYH